MPKDLSHRSAFEQKGETVVRTLVAKGGTIGAEASAWLEEQKLLRDAEAEFKRDEREQEIFSIAKEANSLALQANEIAREQSKAAWRAARYAMYAAIIAATAAIAANKEGIVSLLLG
jgi:hypothetical protein